MSRILQGFLWLTHQMKKEDYLKEILHANSVPTSLPAKQPSHFTWRGVMAYSDTMTYDRLFASVILDGLMILINYFIK